MLTINGSDITKAVITAVINEKVNSGAAVLKFLMLKSEAQKLKNGDRVVLSEKGYTMFSGKIFSRNISRDIAEISAFDSIADLKTVMPINRKAGNASIFIQEVFALAAPYVTTGTVDECDADLVPEQYKNVSLLNILYRVIGEVGVKKGRFVLRDENGTVVFRNEQSLACNTVLDGKRVIDFDYKHSAEDSINYVKLTSNSVEKGFTDTVVVKNDLSIATLGSRALIKKVYGKNLEQMTDLAKALIEEKGVETESLVVDAVGDVTVRAGCRIYCDLDGVGAFWARVCSSQHRFDGKSHFMKLEMERI